MFASSREFLTSKSEGMLASNKEVVVACSSIAEAGITCWDLATGDDVPPRRQNCASPRNGLVCAEQQYLAASQIQRAGSVGSGEIFFWAPNKIQAERSYPLEPIIPLACTSNGVYLAGGGLSGKLYVWDVSSWNLLTTWSGHHKAASCLLFSDDNSLLISGAEDGVVSVWIVLQILDSEYGRQVAGLGQKLCLYSWPAHSAPVTGVKCSTGGANANVVSCSVDQTYKVWSLANGGLLQAIKLQSAINCIILDPSEQALYAGTADGKIVIRSVNICLLPYPDVHSDLCSSAFDAHRHAVTALAFSMCGSSLVSASEDRTVRVWDTVTWKILWELFCKGPVTNLLVVPTVHIIGCYKKQEHIRKLRVTSLASSEAVRNSTESQDFYTLKDPVVFLPATFSANGEYGGGHSYSASSLKRQLNELKHKSTPEALQLEITMTQTERVQALNTAKDFYQKNEDLCYLFFDTLHMIVEKRL